MSKKAIICGLLTFLVQTFAEGNKMESAPYGSWTSSVTAEMVASGSVNFSEIKLMNDKVYWLEERPCENGRITLMSWSVQEKEKELIPPKYNVRNRVHEYGGGSLLVTKNEIYFVNDQDQQIYSLDPQGKIEKITFSENCRFADGVESPIDHSLFYISEQHSGNITNSIVRINPKSHDVKTVVSGNDFYSNPRISPDGQFLAFLTWNHSNMPWDGTELWVLNLKTGEKRLVAGGNSESIGDPKWDSNGELYYVSDKNNWWNIYQEKKKKPLLSMEGEFLLPQWNFGTSIIGFYDEGIICSYVKKGTNFFTLISFNGESQYVDLPYTSVQCLTADKNQMAMIASSFEEPNSIVLVDLKNMMPRVIKSSSKVDKGLISQPIPIEFSSGKRKSHAFYYPPCNSEFSGPANEKPPLLVCSHGGPTAHYSPKYSLRVLYWTSRGFAVVTVNYGGSTGYGRAYRDSLKKQWGIVDVEDCCNAAIYCANHGLADKNRLCIEGGSAGGFTTLASIAFKNVFKVGADYFGVSDLERLALDTHKFESHYLEQLVDEYPAKASTYHERSPIYHIDKINCPIIIFQGDEDAVVPPSQSETMYKSLLERKIPTAYLLFKGEQHGFRKGKNNRKALEAELYFFSKILRFPISDKIEPIFIDNLKENL